MAVKIVIDSASDIDKKEADKFGVTLVPIQIRFGDEEFNDGIDITREEFFARLEKCSELPKTSQINEYAFDEAVKPLLEEGDEVVIIALSSKLSGTYSNAKAVADKYEGKVYAVDSLNASLGERILVQYAVKLAKQDLSAKDIAEELEKVKNRIKVIALVDTLKYLKKGGRISAVVAFAGELLAIKPAVGLLNGEVKLIGKAIGGKKANSLINNLIEKTKGVDFDMPYCLAWSGIDASKLDAYENASKHIWQENSPRFMIGSTIGTHIGPGAVGVAFFEKE